MTVSWGSRGDLWEPDGGESKDWCDVAPGDLLANSRKVWRVIENRPVPVADWTEQDQRYYEATKRTAAVTEEEWWYRPRYLIVKPVRGGQQRHVKIHPYAGLRRQAYALHPHYPVCSDCGEAWPCPEIDITREVRKQTAEVERLASVMPGCCWSCGEPVTARQASIVFEGENLLLPGAPPPVFHLRRGKPYCGSDALKYEERWVAAGEGRAFRLQCPGKLTRHIDGYECNNPACPGDRVRHDATYTHVVTQGGVVTHWAVKCTRCRDAVRRGDGLPVAAVPDDLKVLAEGETA